VKRISLSELGFGKSRCLAPFRTETGSGTVPPCVRCPATHVCEYVDEELQTWSDLLCQVIELAASREGRL
jgi:hypothetical protein